MTSGRGARPVSPVAFFAATLALSWVIWVPLALVRLGLLALVIPVPALTSVGLLGVLVPALVATVLTTRAAGRPGRRALYSRLALWRVGRWWVPVLLLQPVVLLVTALVNNAAGGEPVSPAAGLGAGAVATSVLFLTVASTGEELGWRGVALPALQERYGPVQASVLLGLATATWHLPYWVLQGVAAQYGLAYLAFDYVFVVALTFQLTWLVNHTGGSVLVAVVFHVVFNTVNVVLLPVTASTSAFALLTVVESAIALALLGRLGPAAGAAGQPQPRLGARPAGQ